MIQNDKNLANLPKYWTREGIEGLKGEAKVRSIDPNILFKTMDFQKFLNNPRNLYALYYTDSEMERKSFSINPSKSNFEGTIYNTTSIHRDGLHFDLEAGDMLYFNSNVYHEVYNLSEISISISGSATNPFFMDVLQPDEELDFWANMVKCGTENLLNQEKYILLRFKDAVLRGEIRKTIHSNIKKIYDFCLQNEENKENI